jgi:hypothetical protein
MILINLLCFNEKMMSVKFYETKIKTHIISLSVIIAALSGKIFLQKIIIKNIISYNFTHFLTYNKKYDEDVFKF